MGGRETLGTGYQAAMPEPFHSRGQHLCKCLGKKESVYIRKSFQQGWFGTPRWPRVIVLEHQYGRHDVM